MPLTLLATFFAAKRIDRGSLPKLIGLPILAGVWLLGGFSIFGQAKGGAMSFQISNTAFSNGETIPKKFTCAGPDVSPQLSWKEAPAATQSFALIMYDSDAPAGTWVHWVLYNLPANTRELPEGMEKQEQLAPESCKDATTFARSAMEVHVPRRARHTAIISSCMRSTQSST
jgi:Raf kinase inhibitor-like YbhB/YbcL family protein